jgi:hypothetical protein
MKEYLKQKYHWWSHLLWSLKKVLIYTFRMDFKNFMEAYYWTLIHLSYKSRKMKN